VIVALAGCATPAERFDHRNRARMHGRVFRGWFNHRAYMANLQSGSTTLHVYIEHDGTPWINFNRVSDDPTPRIPFALELMAKDSGPRLFLGRPCYFEPREDLRCNPLLWTRERYSAAVVASMVAALRGFLAGHPYPRVVLIGYSGGGTLAWLMAARVPEATRVVTVASNLDVDEWSRIHDYSPLRGSLNPTRARVVPATSTHFVGVATPMPPPSRHRPRAIPGAWMKSPSSITVAAGSTAGLSFFRRTRGLRTG
jgi:hypothetical protein